MTDYDDLNEGDYDDLDDSYDEENMGFENLDSEEPDDEDDDGLSDFDLPED